MFNNIHAVTAMMIDKYLGPGKIVVDATVGNGKDAAKLLEALDHTGYLFGFDIQEEAIDEAERFLKAQGYEKYRLIKDSHANMDKHIEGESVDLMMFNLGYLPKGDKNITTLLETTEHAVAVGLTLLKQGGFMMIACYPGHESGMEEYKGLQDNLMRLDQKVYNVFHGHFMNQKNNPPALFIIEKIK